MVRCFNGAADHPHAGGEHSLHGSSPSCMNGPSPRGWGAPRTRPRDARQCRTIPTRVGSTQPIKNSLTLSPDHPHAGGEHCKPRTRNEDGTGPSPRGWGAQRSPTRCRPGPRTIPTRVGSTYLRSRAIPVNPDHPHAGGEHLVPLASANSRSGPSPRGWGALPKGRPIPQPPRTIPTRVGSTGGVQIVTGKAADHPHAGGEHLSEAVAAGGDAGPSPRGWGARKRRIRLLHVARTIPTRVGSTPLW